MGLLSSAWSAIRRNIRPLHYLRDIEHEHERDRQKHYGLINFGMQSDNEIKDMAWLETFTPSYFHPTYHHKRPSADPVYGFPTVTETSPRWARFVRITRFILTLPQNIAKYCLEYWPRILEKIFLRLIDIARDTMHEYREERQTATLRKARLSHQGITEDPELSSKIPSRRREVGIGALILFLSLFYYLFKAIRYAARIAFSPWNHAKAGWEAGYKTESILVIEKIELTLPLELDLVDDQGRQVMSTDGGKTFRVVEKIGNTLQLDESGEFKLTAETVEPAKVQLRTHYLTAQRESNPRAASSGAGSDAHDTANSGATDGGIHSDLPGADLIDPDEDGALERIQRSTYGTPTKTTGLACERCVMRDILVDTQGRRIDHQGYVLWTYPKDQIHDQKTILIEHGQYQRVPALLKGTPVPTWKSWLYGGFNLLCSLSLIALSLKYLASSAVAWIAEKVGGLSSIEAATIPAEATLFFETSVIATAVGRAPGIYAECRDACRPQKGRGDVDISRQQASNQHAYTSMRDDEDASDNNGIANAQASKTRGTRRAAVPRSDAGALAEALVRQQGRGGESLVPAVEADGLTV